MPRLSSPIAYPPSSSPTEDPIELRKRPYPEDEPALPKTKKRLFGRNPFEAIGQSRDGAPPALSTKAKDASDRSDNVAQISASTSFCRDSDGESREASSSTSFSSLETIQSKPDDLEPSFGFSRPKDPNSLPPLASSVTSSGKRYFMREKKSKPLQSYEQLVAERSTIVAGKATKSYYGVEIHKLIDEANELLQKPPSKPVVARPDTVMPSVEIPKGKKRKAGNTMWTEKYRARKFTDLVGDERTHRTVLRWLKEWDPIVFPGARKPVVQKSAFGDSEDGHLSKKILLLTGPPGLGKTTLAHVCARQAGYEIVEINASDDRSRNVVNGRIRDCVGTENVRGVIKKVGDSSVRQAGRPVCVVVDEVDGVVGGSGSSGDGGFMKALIDLVMLDQKNNTSTAVGAIASKKGKKGDRFRLLRPMILICNDVYHPSLRPLRSSNIAEIVHVRKPPLDKIVSRMKSVFEKEGVKADGDGVRRLCEATWGISGRKDDKAMSSNAGEGDIRGVMVVGEWAAGKLRASATAPTEIPRLTKRWVEKCMISDLSSQGSGARGIGRGGSRETADRIFMENAGFPKSDASLAPKASGEAGKLAVSSISELAKGNAISLLRNAIDTCGEHDRVCSDAFAAYPSRPFQDDTFLSKPNAAVEWLHFHDTISSRVHAGQEWELMPYLSTSALGFHYLFASSTRHSFGASAASAHQSMAGTDDLEPDPTPFSGPRADFEAQEAYKLNRSTLQSLQASLSAPLHRTFRSPEELATELLPQIVRMLTPNVQPVVVGGGGDQRGTASVRRESERAMVSRAASAMVAVGVEFERSKVEDERGSYGGFVYRMEPPLDTLATFETTTKSPGTGSLPTRFAVRQVLDQEVQKLRALQASEARQARYAVGGSAADTRGARANQSNPKGLLGKAAIAPAGLAKVAVKRDFFGRIVKEVMKEGDSAEIHAEKQKAKGRARVWVSYNEGFSNAVRKPVRLGELMRGL